MRRLLLISLLLIPALAWATACPSGYSDSKLILIPHQNVRSTLTSFPLLLPFNGASAAASFTLTDLKATGSGGKIQSSGNDIVFCDAYSGGNLLNFERVNWVSSSTDTPIWMFYGKAADSDHSSAAAVWSSYGMEVHAPDGSSLTLSDSTGTNTLTNNGATAQTSQIDGGFLVSATGPKWVSVADNASLKPTTGLTYSAWVYPTANVSVGMILTKNNGSDASGYDLYLGSGGSSTPPTCQIANGGSVSILRANANLTLNAWSYVVCTSDSTPTSNSHFKMYVNGAEVTSFSSASFGAATIVTNTTALGIGKRAAGTAFNGEARIDEPRVSNTALLSADWIAAEYYSQTSPNGFALMLDSSTPAGLSAGANCVPVVIDHTKVPSTDQSDFPAFFYGYYPWMADVANGGYAVTGNSGHDIRWFTDNTCTTAADFRRGFWDNTTGYSSWRVRVPTLSHTADTTLYVKIGSSSDTTDLSANWMASYGYVAWYDGGSPTSLSGVSAGSDGITMSCGANVTATLTPIGGGFSLTQALADASTCGYTPTGTDKLSTHHYPVGSTHRHMRVWFRQGTTTGNRNQNYAGYGRANGSGQFSCQFDYSPPVSSLLGMTTGDWQDGSPGIASGASSTPAFGTGNNGDAGWHVCETDFPSDGGQISSMTQFLDGVAVTTPFTYSPTTVINTDDTSGVSAAEVRIGRDAAHGTGYSGGYVTQWEVSTSTFDANYSAARYNNESSPWTFYAFGTSSPVTSGSVRHRVNRF
jgi:hypothetical protein